jgi:selenocysteine-specific translation elongation factor
VGVNNLNGILVGVFGTDEEAKSAFCSSVAKKSEAEGIMVYTRTEGGRRYSFLDTADYPERIQGYARIVSLVDHALYFFPKSGRLSPPDGELAILLGAFGVPGSLELLDGTVSPASALGTLRGTAAAQYVVDERNSRSGSVDLSHVVPRADLPASKTLVYVDRVFTVKGVGTVALGFVMSGTVSVHDQLRPVPGPGELRADVKGIQVNDVDFESAGRGIRVGLSLRGVDPKDLERSHWLDDGSLPLSDVPNFEMTKTQYYKQEIADRELHLQLLGETVPAKISTKSAGTITAQLPWQVPVWEGMKGAIIDLNGGSLRVAGGVTSKF